MHAFFPTGAAIALDMVNIFLTGGSLAGNNIDLVKKEVDMVNQKNKLFVINEIVKY